MITTQVEFQSRLDLRYDGWRTPEFLASSSTGTVFRNAWQVALQEEESEILGEFRYIEMLGEFGLQVRPIDAAHYEALQ